MTVVWIRRVSLSLIVCLSTAVNNIVHRCSLSHFCLIIFINIFVIAVFSRRRYYDCAYLCNYYCSSVVCCVYTVLVILLPIPIHCTIHRLPICIILLCLQVPQTHKASSLLRLVCKPDLHVILQMTT